MRVFVFYTLGPFCYTVSTSLTMSFNGQHNPAFTFYGQPANQVPAGASKPNHSAPERFRRRSQSPRRDNRDDRSPLRRHRYRSPLPCRGGDHWSSGRERYDGPFRGSRPPHFPRSLSRWSESPVQNKSRSNEFQIRKRPKHRDGAIKRFKNTPNHINKQLGNHFQQNSNASNWSKFRNRD